MNWLAKINLNVVAQQLGADRTGPAHRSHIEDRRIEGVRDDCIKDVGRPAVGHRDGVGDAGAGLGAGQSVGLGDRQIG